MIEGELIDAMFSLDYKFSVPNTLYAEELEAYYPELPAQGLSILSVNPNGIAEAYTVATSLSGARAPGVNDLLALMLAKQHSCPLVTGDKRLRSIATTNYSAVEIRGTIWLVEQLVTEGHITVTQAEEAFHKMIEAGSRLPKGEITKLLSRL